METAQESRLGSLRWMLSIPLVLLFLQVAFYAPRLPERVASHFDAAGNPNGWSTRGGFFLGFILMVGIMTLVFLGLSAVLHKLPASLLSMPRRDYWLAPERREETYGFMKRQLIWLGFVTQLFLLVLLQICIRANLKTDPVLPGILFWICLGSYLGYLLLWLLYFLLRFLRTA